MNMKKTMAAIAAGAVAVSAMATTVSALENATFNYNLVKHDEIYGWEGAKGTFTFDIHSIDTVTEEGEAATYAWTEQAGYDFSKLAAPTSDKDTLNLVYKAEVPENTTYAIDTASVKECLVAIDPKTASLADGDAVEYKFTPDTIGGGTWAPALPTGVTAQVTGQVEASFKIVANKTAKVPAGWYDNANTKYDVVSTTTVAPAPNDTLLITAGLATEATDDVIAVTYPDKINFDVNYNANLKNIVIKITNQNVAEQSIVYSYCSDPEAENYNKNLTTDSFTFDGEFDEFTDPVIVSVTAEFDGGWGDFDSKKTINANIDSKAYGVAVVNGCSTTPFKLASFTASTSPKTDVYKPFKTGLKNNQNIIAYLNGNKYNNVDAVLNDAISNYDNVTFTFHTAGSSIGYVVYQTKQEAVKDSDGDIMYYETKDATDYSKVYTPGYKSWMTDAAGSYETALALAGGNADNLIAIYSTVGGATSEYTGFAQHLYPTYYTPEATDYEGFDWAGYNLFEGALIINEAWTMSLAQTDHFDWTQTTLSFDWDSIMDGYDVNRNDYAVYLHSMKLATSTTWYWDNLVVDCTVGAEEDASSDAGANGDGAGLDDTDDTDDGEGDITVPADDDDETKADTEPAAPSTPDVSNPTTGNASVALAVIPVALAAAAVVAKKRS